MLYKLKQAGDKTTFVRLNATSMADEGLLECQMEQWLADNPTAVLPEAEASVLVISQETPFKNVTDILAIDVQGNLLIIEVKRGQSPRDVIAQALEYASDVADWDYERLNKTAIKYFARRSLGFQSLVEAFSATFGIPQEDLSESQFNQQQRVFVVGEVIDEKLQRTARWLMRRGVSISCVSYTLLTDSQSGEFLLDFNEEVRTTELAGGGRHIPNTVQTPTEDAAVERLPDGLKNVYREIKKRVLLFGEDVTTYATQVMFNFKSARCKFAEVTHASRENKFVINVRPEGFHIAENESDVVHGLSVKRLPDKHKWATNHQFVVTETTELDSVEKLLRQSYNGVNQKS
ncbi:MAG: hypothetical protein NT013_08770 [Planctomycetia bacterium]|nr:hypothetical protein [Planctomycetia bacterium]